jgi:hypothetical protein
MGKGTGMEYLLDRQGEMGLAASDHAPVDFALDLPETWTEDPARQENGQIPKDVRFKTKLYPVDKVKALSLGRAAAHGLEHDLLMQRSTTCRERCIQWVLSARGDVQG